MKIKKLMNMLEFFYPKYLAEANDNVGLIIGDERRVIKRVLTTLEITNEVIDEAIERQVELIVSHHPIIYKPITSLNYKDPYVRMYTRLIKNDIAVYAMHTNVDVCPNGMSEWISDIVGLKNQSVFIQTNNLNMYKISVETTQSKMYDLIDLFKRLGVGQKANVIENTNITPKVKYIRDTEENESNIDILVLESYFMSDQKSNLIYELNKNDYKNFEILKLENNHKVLGYGKVGTIKTQSLEDLANKFKESYSLDFCKFVGARETIVSKVAILPGSGAKYIAQAKKMGCDVLITGDVGFHDAQLAKAAKLCIIDPGHNIEIIFNDAMSQIINMFDDIEAVSSEIDTEPFEVV